MAKLMALILMTLLLTGCDGFTTIEGTVKDVNGNPIKDVKLVLMLGGRKVENRASEDGSYSLSTSHAPFRVQPRLTATKKGYKPYQKEFPLAAGTIHKLDIILEAGSDTIEGQVEEKKVDESDSKSLRRARRTKL